VKSFPKREWKEELKAPLKNDDDEKDLSLTRESNLHNGKLQNYSTKDGEFESYPEILPQTIQILRNREYKSLFPIQQQCFYPIYNREDVIARDLTGSGKTLAFGLPLIEFLRKKKSFERKIQAIVLAPTRELAL
jgi:superfamily II DNA/RNA helicase